MRALLAGDWRVTGGVLTIARRIWEVGVAGWPVTGRRRGRSQRYCGGLDCGFYWWRSGDTTRTQNVSEYMLVLALCLVDFSFYFYCICSCDATVIYGQAVRARSCLAVLLSCPCLSCDYCMCVFLANK